MSAFAEWLDRHGLGKYAGLFAENAIALDVLPSLTERHLEQLGMPLGDRIRLRRAVSALVEENTRHLGRPGAAERRQLTVMFCDLVGSTQLSRDLDPEDYREIIRAYRSAAARVVARYEGSVAQYVGDGVLAYFGYPVAHEDDAERAIRAAFDIVAAVGALDSGSDAPLRVRIGIATGLVVIGDLAVEFGGQERTAMGETPNLAARLQEAAAPDCIVVASSTKRLVEGRLELERLPELALKGIDPPVTAYRALAVRDAARVRALVRQRLGRFVGRASELEHLRRLWEETKTGAGRVVLLEGEAGIGKSLLAETLREHVRSDAHYCIRFQCSPFHTNSAFYPVIEQLSRAAGITSTQEPAAKRRRLEELLRSGRAEIDEESSVALMCALLSVEQPRDRLPAMTPRQQKTATIELLRKQLAALAKQAPVLLIVEDAHWIDPSTRELLQALLPDTAAMPLLLVLTHRPGFDRAWIGAGPRAQIALARLDSAQSATLARRVAGAQPLAPEIVEQIVDRSDGIPLFIEEMTKSVLESGTNADVAAMPAALQPRPIAVPATLQDSLMARLDRLGPAREVAQIGAVLGREFSRELLAASLQIDESELDAALERLMAAELLFLRRPAPAASYAFKHSLVRDAAYDSLLRRRRQELHGRIARILEERFPENAAAEPEVLAQHFEHAGLPEKAVKYWRRAGRRAYRRSAIQESIAHFTRGLRLVAELADPAQRLEREIALLTGLGEALMLSKGFAAAEVRAVYERAETLAREMGEAPQAAQVVFGLWAYHHVRADMAKARLLAERLNGIARRIDDAQEGLAAQAVLGITCHCMGEFAASRRYHENVIRAYRFEPDRARARTYVSDPGAVSRTYLATTLWCLGLPEQALRMSADAVATARATSHPYTLATVLALTARFHQIRRDPARTLEVAQETISVSTRFDFPIWKTLGTLLASWVRAEQGDDAAFEQMHAAIASYREIGVGISLPYYTALLAEQCARRGRIEDADSLIADAISESISTKAHAEEPEILRLAFEIQRRRDAAEPAGRLQEALALAERQAALGWRLRAAISLARHLASRGSRQQARNALLRERSRFGEGLGRDDLQAADALLADLE